MNSITFFTKSVSVKGGKEKVLTQLANLLSSKKFKVSIVIYDGGNSPAWNLSPGIAVISLNLAFHKKDLSVFNRIAAYVSDIIKTRRFFKKNPTDVIISTDYIVSCYAFLSKRRNARHIVWEHLSHIVLKNKFWKRIRKTIYSRAEKVVALNKEEGDYYQSLGASVMVMPNPVEQQNRILADFTSQSILWVGSISYDKGIKDLIEVAKNVKALKLPYTIEVYGAGPDLDFLLEQIKSCELSQVINFKGVSDGQHIYPGSSVLLLTSRHECFPTVILEAFSYGVPVISYDCNTGPRHIIHDEYDGFLIQQGNVEKLVKATLALLHNETRWKEISNNAFQTSKHYCPSNIYTKWIEILND